ncbi:MAG: hypothetical protein V4726_01295 [Verrucomicrobiota bacterium]
MPGISRILLACLLAGMLPSCTGWPRGWMKARTSAPADGLSGAWQGTWKSGRNGHHGRLRCAVFPSKDGKWEYRYRATWAGFFCAGFTVRCEAAPDGPGQWKVRGKKDLGPVFGGIFTHEAQVSGDNLRATYSARMDHGVMELRRVGAAGQTGIP